MRSDRDDLAGAGTSDSLRRHLSASEQLLWTGAPRPGVVLRSYDWLAIPFGLAFCAFSLFWLIDSTSHLPAYWWSAWIPMIGIGLYLAVGRLWHEVLVRRHTFYAVTNERILIRTGKTQQRLRSLNMRTLADLSLVERSDGVGTITFGPAPTSDLWPGLHASKLGPPVPQFEVIDDAKRVYDIVRDAQRRA